VKCPFNNKKSPGPDNIGPRLLIEIATGTVGPLLYLFNLSLPITGLVPDSLKIAKVIPVFKKGDSCLVENYRPISLLNIFDKILEKIMCTRLYCYLSDHHILYDYQFGFRKCHSTTLALIDVLDQIYYQLDNSKTVLGIFLDLQKAFDTVDNKILLAKLYNYGIRGIIYSWFKNYLTDRMQFVSVSGVSSQTRYITCGVTQGSVLGPLLFLVYVNDIGNSISGIPIKLFADDTNLFIFSESIDFLKADAEDKLKLLNSWFVANKLSLSLD